MVRFRQFELTRGQRQPPKPALGESSQVTSGEGIGHEARLARFAADGATATEYGLLAAGSAVAMISSVNQLGCEVANMFGRMASSIQSQ
jgi:Flp pilus assembly pilin Flp